MTSIAAPSMSGVNAAKRKFFQCHDRYVKYHQPVSHHAKDTASNVVCKSTLSGCTIYGSSFSPTSYRNKRYFVACTSNGCIAVWDTQPSSSSVDSEKSGGLTPILSVRVGGENRCNNNVLYDLQFIQTSNGENMLVASGDPGIVIYKWSHFEAAIAAKIDGGEACLAPEKPKCQDPSSAQRGGSFELRPITTFQPHPSPASSFGESVEINSTSYSKSDDILFGAAGDAFGCYQWDLGSEKLLGTFGGASRFDGGGHRDYLHVVKAIPEDEGMGSRYVITGGEDGNMGFWDGKDRKLIDMMNIQAIMDKNKDLITSNATANNRSFMSNSSTPWNNGSNLWVSSMDTNGNWLAVAGGAENTNNSSITSRSGPSSSGFVALWHLPTRTFTSGCVTRESLNTVVYNPSLDCFVSGGNEGRISLWESTTMVRSGRSWSTPPATYTISDDPESNMMVVGGSGGTLDCFADRVKVSQLQFTS